MLRPHRLVFPMAMILALILCMAWNPIIHLSSSMPTSSNSSKIVTNANVDPMLIANRHLDIAQRRIASKIDGRFPLIDGLFQRAHGHIESFVQVSLGWGSKWRIAADAIPFTRGDRHEQFMRKQFEEKLFSSSELETAIQQSIESFLIDLRSIESAMLVELRADIPDLPEFDRIKSLNKSELESLFEDSVRSALAKSGSEFRSMVSSQVVSLVAGEVMTQVALRLGVSAGVLGAGVASGWATLGIGIVVGLVIDQIVSMVWDWMYEPEIELSVELARKLSSIRNLICDGDEQVVGLQGQLQQLADSRDTIRRDAIQSMLSSSLDSASR